MLIDDDAAMSEKSGHKNALLTPMAASQMKRTLGKYLEAQLAIWQTSDGLIADSQQSVETEVSLKEDHKVTCRSKKDNIDNIKEMKKTMMMANASPSMKACSSSRIPRTDTSVSTNGSPAPSLKLIDTTC